MQLFDFDIFVNVIFAPGNRSGLSRLEHSGEEELTMVSGVSESLIGVGVRFSTGTRCSTGVSTNMLLPFHFINIS